MEVFYKDKDFFTNINLSKEFKFIVENNSLNVLLITKDINTRCKCYNHLHKCGDKNCKLCHGDGIAKKAVMASAFIDTYDRFNSPGNINDIMGEAHTVTRDIYILNHNDITEESYVVVIGFIDGIPQTVYDVYYISDVSRARSVNGQIEYTRLKGKSAPHKVTEQDTLLKRMPLNDKINLVNGGVYKWMV